MKELGREAAELARTVSASMANHAEGVGYVIAHMPDRSWQLTEVMQSSADIASRDFHLPGPPRSGIWSETLCHAAYGSAALMFATTIPELIPDPAVHGAGPSPASSNRAFTGMARPNPSFLYRGAQNVEFFFRLPVEADGLAISLQDCLALTAIMTDLAKLAHQSSAPILFLQAPSSAPPRSVESGDTDQASAMPWRAANAFGVRLALALDPQDPATRLRLYEQLGELATQAGIGLWIGDRRDERRGGQWFRIVSSAADRYREWSSDVAPEVLGQPAYAYPLTVVGPARVGTTAEVLANLQSYGVGVLSASITALEDLAFIHLCLAMGRPPADAGVLLDNFQAQFSSAIDVIGPECSLYDLGRRNGMPPVERATDYVAHCGAAVRINAHQVPDRRALWAAWQVPDEADALLLTVRALERALEETLPNGARISNVEYLLCRSVQEGSQRGRAKLSLPVDAVPTARGADGRNMRSELCRLIEGRWHSVLAEDLPVSEIEVEFAWRETWLGRWSTVLLS